MIYLSFKSVKEKDNVIDVLKSLNIKEDDYFIDKSSNESIKKLKKSNIVICDSSNDMLRAFVALNKKVFVFRNSKSKKNVDDDTIFTNDKVLKYSQGSELEDLLSYEINNRNRRKKVIVTFSCSFFIILFLSISITYIFNSKIFNHYKNTNIVVNDDKKVDDTDFIEKVDYKYENIIFYGDSITDFYDLNKFYKDMPVINSGTSGYQTTDLLNLVDDRVIKYNPTKVFIMIGTNDIAFTDISDDELVSNIEKLIDKIKEKRENTEIYIEAIYPVNRNEDNDIVQLWMVNIRENGRISRINDLIKDMCLKNNVTYIDMYSVLSDENGDLKLDYTNDGLHLSDNGYGAVTKKIMEYIDPTSDNH